MEKIYISPFSIASICLYHMLKKQGTQVAGFMDSNLYLWNQAYDGVGIYQRCYIPNAIINICTNNESTAELIKIELLGYGYEEETIKVEHKPNELEIVNEIKIDELLQIIPKSSQLNMERIENLLKIKKLKSQGIDVNKNTYKELYGLNRKELFDGGKIFLKQIEVIVTNRCSLKCKKCAAGIQYFEKPTEFNPDLLIKDYDRMLELIDWVDRIVIIGGEPFLYKDLDKILDGIYQNINTYSKVGGIKIITNGTVVPSEKVLDTISKYDTIVWISDYGRQSRNIGELIDVLRRKKISYSVLNIQEWSDVIQLNDSCCVQTSKQLLERRKNGCVTRCRTLAGGRFYLCSLLKSMDYLEITPFDKENYIDIYDKNAKALMCDMLNENSPLPKACSFCNGCSEIKWNEGGIVAAEQSQNPLPYKKSRMTL